MRGRIQTSLGRHFRASFGDEANNVRLEREGKSDDFRDVGHFKVEAGFDHLAQAAKVTILHMAPVFAEMGGNAVSPGRFAEESRLNGVGFAAFAAAIARFAHGGDMIDINAEFEHGGVQREGRPGPVILAIGRRLVLTGPAGVSVSQCESHSSSKLVKTKGVVRATLN